MTVLNSTVTRLLTFLMVGWLLLSQSTQSLGAEPTFRQVLDEQTLQTLQKVQSYIQSHPDAPDLPQAYEWLLTTAQTYGKEPLVLRETKQILEQGIGDDKLQQLARRVRSLGLAAEGDFENALEIFQAELRAVRLRSPQDTADYGLALAAKAQLAGDPETAIGILNALSQAFFLNSTIERLCKNRITRLELIGSDAPQITCEDLEGKPVLLEDYAGKVVVVDFWATNCIPCLKQFPEMKNLYAAQHPNGLEILGISLDGEAVTVEQFQETWNLPWPLMLSTTDQDATRRRYEAPSIPAVIIIDRQGKVAGVDLTGADLEQMVQKLLTQEP